MARNEPSRATTNQAGAAALRDGDGGKKGKGLLWLLLGLLALALIGLAIFLIVQNAGDDDEEGIDVSGQDCPEYAGNEGKNETAEVATDPEPFFGCKVSLIGPAETVFGGDAYLMGGGEGDPILVVRGADADAFDFKQGDPTNAQGVVEEKLDAAALAEDMSQDFDPEALKDYEGKPYVSAEKAEIFGGG